MMQRDHSLDIRVHKQELRAYFRKTRISISPDITLVDEFAAAENVFCYVSVSNEASTIEILELCLNLGKNLYVPRCNGDNNMSACRIASYSELSVGKFGLLEPPKDAEVAEAIDFAIIPAIAFDRSGYRLGQGGGYYDKWLSSNHPFTVGLCCEAAFVDELPREDHDFPVDCVLTEEGLHRFA